MFFEIILQLVQDLVNSLVLVSVDVDDLYLCNQVVRKVDFRGEGDCYFVEI